MSVVEKTSLMNLRIAIISISLVLALFDCAGIPCATGRAWYVSPIGNDSAAGSMEMPWRTLAKAAGMARPGDTVYLRAGVWNERLVVVSSGTADAPITFASYPGETTVLDGTGIFIPNTWGGIVESVYFSHLRFIGIRVRNSAFAGIFACSGEDIKIMGCSTSMTQGPGIQAWADRNLTIDGNEVDRAGLGGEGFQECISVSETSSFFISNNKVHDGMTEGIDVKDGCSFGTVSENLVYRLSRLGIYVDGWDSDESDIDVHHNVVHHCTEGIRVNSENGGTVSRIRIRGNTAYGNSGVGFWVGPGGVATAAHPVEDVIFDGNLAYGNGDGFCIAVTRNGRTERITLTNNISVKNRRSGIQVADYSSGTAVMSDILIMNNTVVGNGTDTVTDGGWGAGGIFISESLPATILVRNNIVSGNALFSIGTAAAFPNPVLEIDHNLVNDFRNAGQYHETRGIDWIAGDPAFVDASSGNYHLRRPSPAIDAGSGAQAPGTDFDGIRRPVGSGVDMGAFEQ